MLTGSGQQAYTSLLLHMITSTFPNAGSPSQIRAHGSLENKKFGTLHRMLTLCQSCQYMVHVITQDLHVEYSLLPTLQKALQ